MEGNAVEFTSREIAIAFWTGAFLIWSLRSDGVRRSLKAVLASLVQPPILGWLICMAAYVAASIWVLYQFGFWTSVLLKGSLLWFVFSAPAMAIRATKKDQMEPFRASIRDAVRITILFEFIIVTYTFSLAIELVMIPVVTLTVLIDAYAGTRPKYRDVGKITSFLLAIGGLTIFILAAHRAWADLYSLQSLDTLRKLLLPSVLSILFLPFLYVLLLYIDYDSLLVRLRLFSRPDHRTHRYARNRIFEYVVFSVARARWLLENRALDLSRIRTKADADAVFDGLDRQVVSNSVERDGT